LWRVRHVCRRRSGTSPRRGGAAIPRRPVSRLLNYLRAPNALRGPLSSNNGAPLTSREWQILDLLGNGLTNRQVARQLNVSVATVRSHRSRGSRKLNPDHPPDAHQPQQTRKQRASVSEVRDGRSEGSD
jgi:DNA-binding NarL/FixJ family response regulator